MYGHIGHEVPIAALLDRGIAALPPGVGTEAIGRGPGCRLQRRCRRRMVAMGVRNQDVSHLFAGKSGQQCRDVLVEIRAGIDDRDVAVADDIGPGAAEGERARIARDNAANARRHPLEPAVFEGKFAAERNLDSHARSLPEIRRAAQRLKCYRLVVREGAVAMKINLEIDCTPEEMRKFFGLPEVQPLQEALLKEVQERMTANIKAMDAKAMIEAWLPATLKGFEQLQQIFMARMAGGPREKK